MLRAQVSSENFTSFEVDIDPTEDYGYDIMHQALDLWGPSWSSLTISLGHGQTTVLNPEYLRPIAQN